MNNANEQRHYSLDELCSLTDISKRTVRFYMQQGLVDRSEGQRKGAYYLERHLMQLLEIKKWQQAGLSLERIKQIIRDEKDNGLIPPIQPQQPGSLEVWSHLNIADGIQLQIEPGRSGLSPEQIRKLLKSVTKELNRITGEEE
ncbi:MAG: MerR family transcriptional regulator [Gammaproteobacteria bacterium]|nr:MerR family transcriptional regulator [Gammaproteobacteria bacterium]